VTPAVGTPRWRKRSDGDFEGAARPNSGRPDAAKAEAEELLKAKTALIDYRGEISRMKAGRADAPQLPVRPRRPPSGVEGCFSGPGALSRSARARRRSSSRSATSARFGGEPLQRRRRRIGPDVRAALIWQGERETAERLAGEPRTGSRRATGVREDAASKVPKVAPNELEARRLFYAAERDFAKPEGRG